MNFLKTIHPRAKASRLSRSYPSKKLSYSWAYEQMVRETVRDMVKPEYLIK